MVAFDEKELIARRLKLWEENKKLLAKAESENRSYRFSTEEQELFDKRNAEIDSITGQIKSGRASNRINEEMESYRPEDQIPHMGTILDDDDPSGGECYRDRNGREVRLLKRGEKLAELRGNTPGYGSTHATAGRIVHDFVCGGDGARRSMSEGAVVSGGVLLSPFAGASLIDLARSKSIAFQAGAKTLPMATAEVTLARITADPAISWFRESEPIAAGDPSLGGLNLKARKMGVIVKVSRELLNDSPNVEQLVNDLLARTMAAELDRVVFAGDSSPGAEPNGILNNTDGVQEIASVGSPVWSDFIDAQKLVRTANGEPNMVAFSPTTESTLSKLLVNAESNNHATMPESLSGLSRFASTRFDDATALVGDMTQAVIAVRQEVQLAISDTASDGTTGAFTSDEVWIRGTWRGDFGLLQPTHFVKLTGIV